MHKISQSTQITDSSLVKREPCSQMACHKILLKKYREKSNYPSSVVMLAPFCWYNCINIGRLNSISGRVCCQVLIDVSLHAIFKNWDQAKCFLL